MKQKKEKTVTIPEAEYLYLRSKVYWERPLLQYYEKIACDDRTIYRLKDDNKTLRYEIHVKKDTIFPALIIGEDALPKTVRPWQIPVVLLLEILADQNMIHHILETEYAVHDEKKKKKKVAVKK